MSTEIAVSMSSTHDRKTSDIAASKPTSGLSTRWLFCATGALLFALAWYVREWQPYTSGSDIGYWLGVAGGSLMAALLLYPLRKRLRWTKFSGPLRYWFRFHMVAGIGGPLLVLYHSTFHVGSFNAAIALGSMLLVAASGIVGRFLYRRIHHGLYGREATFKELQEDLAKQLQSLNNNPAALPAVRLEIDAYLRHVREAGNGKLARLLHFVGLGWRRRASNRRIEMLIPQRRGTRRKIAETLGAAQQAYQFNAYVRLFALWHVVHIPFLGMLLITAIAHVVAVHTY